MLMERKSGAYFSALGQQLAGGSAEPRGRFAEQCIFFGQLTGRGGLRLGISLDAGGGLCPDGLRHRHLLLYAGANLAAGRSFDEQAYSQEAIDLWNYIQDETDPAARFCFFKNAVLSLNTGRAATRNLSPLGEGDYILLCRDDDYGGELSRYEEDQGVDSLPVEEVYRSENFTLYSLAGPAEGPERGK